MAKYDKGDLNGAIIDLSKAIEINPKLAVAYASRGAAKLRQGADGEAEDDFEIARKLDSSADCTRLLMCRKRFASNPICFVLTRLPGRRAGSMLSK
jgi:tetratricopeptide (TPR) repeat protein